MNEMRSKGENGKIKKNVTLVKRISEAGNERTKQHGE
jgi:hypothetical protein